MKRMSGENGEAGIYVIDQDYKVVYLNDMAKIYYPNLQEGMYCYQGIEKKSSPCMDCPDAKENSGHIICYNTASETWMDVSLGAIDWPGYKGCKLVMTQPVDEKNKNLFYYLTETTIYEGLLELNLSANTYKVLFHETTKLILPSLEGELNGLIKQEFHEMIHPDEQQEFIDFWNLDTLTERLKAGGKVLKAEFRRKSQEGDYVWIKLTVVLFRCSDCRDIIVMCYIQDIDDKKRKDEEDEKKLREKREETDSMTGLYRYGPFFEKAEQRLKELDCSGYFMVAIDIEHFKLFNEWYGEEEGDRFLIKIGDYLKEMEAHYGSVAGYMGGDDFVILIPDELSVLKELEKTIDVYARQYGGNAGFMPAFGVYRVEDLNLPVSMMYDRAAIALNSIKGSYTKRVGWYDPGMKRKMESDQVLLSEIQRALDKKEFIFYAQPQCNMLTGKIIGLESLVRWQHPERGLISPGEFIPLLERNGFITYLDVYIWEMVCNQLSIWKKSGRRPIPISVNMSRMDIYAIDVVEKFKELISRYEIDPKYLEIEITESAYAEDYDLIRKVVEDLRRAGFPVFMDDFGSGYSSLNMLKDVNVDVIKIDTKFLDMNENSKSRGMGILETIVRMARVMQLKVIAEGVEEKEQVDFLINIGCIYGQGYYYYEPLPISVIETLLTEDNNLDYRGIQARQLKQLKLEELFNENIISEATLNNMLGAIALYELYEDSCEVLRVNEEYYRVTGDNPIDMEERRRYVLNKVYKDDTDWVLNIFEEAYNNPIQGAEGVFRRHRSNGELMWLHLRVFFLREQDDRRLYYGAIRDATEQMEQRQKLIDSQNMLKEVLKLAGKNLSFNNVTEENQWAASALFAQMAPGGFLGVYCENGLPIYFANSEMLRVLNYDSYESFVNEIDGLGVNLIHPADLKMLKTNTKNLLTPGMEYSFRHRMKKQDGSWIWVVNKGRVVQADDGKLAIVSAFMDITDTVLAQKRLQDANEILQFKNDELKFLSSVMLGGYFRCRKTERMELLYASPRFMSILGYNANEIMDLFKNQLLLMIHPEDRGKIKPMTEPSYLDEGLKGMEFRILSNSGYKWILCHAKLSVKAEDSFLYGVMLDTEEIGELCKHVEESRNPALPEGIRIFQNREAAVLRMQNYLSRHRFLSSGLVLFQFHNEEGNEKATRTTKQSFIEQALFMKRFFREDDIFCINGDYEIMILCRNIREEDMKIKSRRILKELRYQMMSVRSKKLLPVRAGIAMIPVQEENFEKYYNIARTSLLKDSFSTDAEL